MTFFKVFLGFLVLGATGVAAQDTALSQMQTSYAMFEIGRAKDEPLYMLAAARLRKTIPTTPGTLAPQNGEVENGSPLGWSDMLDVAAPLIAGDPLLEGLAEDIRAERSKGVTNGPVYSIIKIRSAGKDVYPKVPFIGGQYAEIYVEGPAGGDMNLLVNDAKGRLVCSDTDISAIAYCGWRPAKDGTYDITVVNETARSGQYSLMTN